MESSSWRRRAAQSAACTGVVESARRNWTGITASFWAANVASGGAPWPLATAVTAANAASDATTAANRRDVGPGRAMLRSGELNG
jgi:hypothetical protein